jgi:undecaprenyl-phosphate 4-deoxy-4-formamido-L-arabinose transferase
MAVGDQGVRAGAGGVALSIVIPVYNGASSVPTLVDALAELDVPGGHEIVLVNDGSLDDSLQVCRERCGRNDAAITLVNLSRNFGEHNAVMAGLTYARGAHVVTMDDDLQNPPAEVVRLWQHARDHGYDVVYTRSDERSDSSWRRLGSRLANWCADRLIDKTGGLYLSSFRCISAFTVGQIVRHAGPFPYVDGLIMQVTQNIGVLDVRHLPRTEGRSNYTLRPLLRLFFSIFLNFSVAPLRAATIAGFVLALLGALGVVVVVVEALAVGTPRGWASLMAAVLLLAGVQLIMLGLLGEYVGRLFLTVNRKPQFAVRDVTVNDRAKDAA